MAGRFPELSKSDLHMENKLGNRMIKQLLNSVIAKYCDFSVSHRSVICLSLFWQIIDPLTTDKLQCFAQPHAIILLIGCNYGIHVPIVFAPQYFVVQLWCCSKVNYA